MTYLRYATNYNILKFTTDYHHCTPLLIVFFFFFHCTWPREVYDLPLSIVRVPRVGDRREVWREGNLKDGRGAAVNENNYGRL